MPQAETQTPEMSQNEMANILSGFTELLGVRVCSHCLKELLLRIANDSLMFLLFLILLGRRLDNDEGTHGLQAAATIGYRIRKSSDITHPGVETTVGW